MGGILPGQTAPEFEVSQHKEGSSAALLKTTAASLTIGNIWTGCSICRPPVTERDILVCSWDYESGNTVKDKVTLWR